jgi:hypothetical protein
MKARDMKDRYHNEGYCRGCGEYVMDTVTCSRADALKEHRSECSVCFDLKDGTPVLCAYALGMPR